MVYQEFITYANCLGDLTEQELTLALVRIDFRTRCTRLEIFTTFLMMSKVDLVSESLNDCTSILRILQIFMLSLLKRLASRFSD